MAQQREMAIAGSFPDGLLNVETFVGREELGRPFEYSLSLLSPSPSLDISALVGDTVSVSVEIAQDHTRYFHGYVTRMGLGGTFDNLARYNIVVRPWLFLLSSRVNSRVFQHKSVLEIATALFDEHGFSDYEIKHDNLAGSYPAREFVVQYRESDFDFISRLFEHEGIYYYFRHEKGRHVLVVADSLPAHHNVPGYEKVAFHPQGPGTPDSEECINAWQVSHEWRAGAYASGDYDFERPRDPLPAQRHVQARHKKGDLEVFEYPGGYTDAKQGDQFVLGRLNALQAEVELAHAGGDVRGLGAGNLFKLTDYPEAAQNKEYLVVQASFDASNTPHQTGPAAQGGHFNSAFVLLDSKVPFRPRATTPVARVLGPQTAIVVGVDGEEITTETYGRVRIQFRWDREGKFNQDSSCWVRVAQVWAGQGWGALHIPRIGQEVIVEFLDGDPDRPIITGSVYNADNLPPYALPKNKTQSGIKSRSTTGGGPSNFNEIRFEDKKGSEELHIQAEKDFTSHVKHNRSADVGANDSVSVGGDRSVTVSGNLSVKVKGGGKSPNQSDLDVTGKYHVKATDSIEMESDTHIKLICGDSFILIDKTHILLNSGGNAYVLIDQTVFAEASGKASLLLNETVFAEGAGKGSVIVDDGVLLQSSAGAIVVVDKNKNVTIDGTKVQVTGSTQTVVSGNAGSVKADAGGIDIEGPQIKLNG